LSGIALTDQDELIIVDSGSTDNTLMIAQKNGAKIVIAEPPFNYSKSLNIGFKMAKNPWVLVVSSHCVPAVPDFIGIYRREIAIFSQDVIVGYGPGRRDAAAREGKTIYYSGTDFEKMVYVCGNANTIYRKSAWDEFHFDENVRTGEDKLWLKTMISRGYKFAYVPSAVGINNNQASLIYMFRKGYRDIRALREPSYRPMTFFQFAGVLKKAIKRKLEPDCSYGDFVRLVAHGFGQFLGSYRSEDNTPRMGGS
jgi:glycosyltransferase involved in cell wall biosynthesis